MFQIRIYGRAGQGAKTMAQILAESGLKAGNFVQAFPFYGPARTGALMNAYVRLDSRPINIHSEIDQPDAVVVIDPLLMETENIGQGLKKDKWLIINSPQPVAILRKKLEQRGMNKGVKIVSLPASDLAFEILKKDFANIVLLGVLVKATKIVELKYLIEAIKKNFEKKSKELAVLNSQAVIKGYNFIRHGKKE